MNMELVASYDTLKAAYTDDTIKTAATPQAIADAMTSMVGRWGDSILVVSDICLLLAVVWHLGASKTKVSYLPNTESDSNIALLISRANQKLSIEILPVCYNNPENDRSPVATEKFEKMLKDTHMEFDVVIGNPPYKGSTHMNFLKLAFDCTKPDGTVIFIQPSDHFLTLRAEKSKVVTQLAKFTREIKVLNGNAYFKGAAFFVPLMIIRLVNSPRTEPIKVSYPDRIEHFDSVKMLSIWGQVPGALSLFEKLSLQRDNNITKHTCWVRDAALDSIPDNGFIVWFSGIRGHTTRNVAELFYDDFFTIVQKTPEPHIFLSTNFKKEKKGSGYAYFFKTRVEAENFYKYLRTKFVRQALAFMKNDQNLNLRLVPWMDFIEEPTDELLAKRFNLSETEIAFMGRLPDYYNDSRTIAA